LQAGKSVRILFGAVLIKPAILRGALSSRTVRVNE
jgi:hypothetical protein